jgi:hypothetical protein
MPPSPYEKFKHFRLSAHRPRREFMEAHDAYGFYEIGIVQGTIFIPRYGGRSAGTTLRQRMKKHFDQSHNVNITKTEGSLFPIVKTGSDAEARYVEALNIVGMEYPWNKRQEWRRHSALEI